MPLFSLTPDNRLATDEEILADLRRVASLLPAGNFLTSRRYRLNAGRFSSTIITNRFGSWNNALTTAGLSLARHFRLPDEQFFLQLEKVWRSLNRQPTRRDFNSQSTILSSTAYTRRFGSWRAALQAFTTWANSPSNPNTNPLPELPKTPTPLKKHPHAHPLRPRNTPRFPSLRLRHRILKRDNFKCTHCGRSPATHPNTILHIDHIHPWSKGGPTIPKNLQTLCAQYNRGKSTM
jgi:hypothetical protein